MKPDTLSIRNLHASTEGKVILHGIDLVVKPGEVHAVMGPNGSGKSTLASVIMGHPSYSVHHSSEILFSGKNMLPEPTEVRAKHGIFLAFQSPVAVPGVSVLSVLRSAYATLHGKGPDERTRAPHNPVMSGRMVTPTLSFHEFLQTVKHEASHIEFDDALLTRSIHDGFSGGERKKVEMLTALVLQPRIAMFDEIDTGLDVDALKAVSKGVSALVKKKTGIMIITHYQRILRFVKPDYVHVMVEGKIVTSGDASLARTIEARGYAGFIEKS